MGGERRIVRSAGAVLRVIGLTVVAVLMAGIYLFTTVVAGTAAIDASTLKNYGIAALWAGVATAPLLVIAAVLAVRRPRSLSLTARRVLLVLSWLAPPLLVVCLVPFAA